MCEGGVTAMEWLQLWGYRWAVRTSMESELFSVRTCTLFLSSSVSSQRVYQRMLCPLTSALPLSSIVVTCSLLARQNLLQAKLKDGKVYTCGEWRKERKSCSNRPPLLTSNCQKVCKIQKRQWWLKVVSVRNSSLFVCLCLWVSWLVVLLTSDALDFPSVTPFKLTRSSVWSALPWTLVKIYRAATEYLSTELLIQLHKVKDFGLSVTTELNS